MFTYLGFGLGLGLRVSVSKKHRMLAPKRAALKSRGPIYKAQLHFFENFSNGILSAPYGLKIMVFCYSLVFQLLNV